MSEDNDNPPLIDLSSLRMMPDWVANFGKQTTDARPVRDEEDTSRRPQDRRGKPGDHGRSFGQGGRGQGDGGRRDFRSQRDGDRRDQRGQGPGGPRRHDDRRPRSDRGPSFQGGERAPFPAGVKAIIEPETQSVEALASYVRLQGRAFSLFDAARLIAMDAERHQVKFECGPERLVGFYKLQSGVGLFETKEEAFKFALRDAEALKSYYQIEDVELEEPKGQFNSVAVCSITGEIFGPPSHHSYPLALKRFHAERFGNMPLEDYKRKVDVKSDPELVEKWKEKQRKGTKWTWLNGEAAEGATPVEFTKQSEMEAHFRRFHGDTVAIEVREAVLPGTVRREQLSSGLGRLFRKSLEETRKHLFELSQRLAQQLERRGLKLFKRRGGKLYVSRIRPRAVDPAVVFSARVAAIVERVRSEPGVLASKLLAEFAPANVEATAVAGDAGAAETKSLTEEQRGVILDLRWLADEGYIIEYSDGPVFLGIQGDPPNAKPTAASKPVSEATAESAAAEGDVGDESSTKGNLGAEERVETASEFVEAPAVEEDAKESAIAESDTATIDPI